jgi:DNA-binding Xre family transcriptional regulator
MRGGTMLVVSYKKLWKLLIDRDMNKQDLQILAKISPSSVAKLSKHQNVSMDVLLKIGSALRVNVEDIMEFVPNNTEKKNVAEAE